MKHRLSQGFKDGLKGNIPCSNQVQYLDNWATGRLVHAKFRNQPKDADILEFRDPQMMDGAKPNIQAHIPNAAPDLSDLAGATTNESKPGVLEFENYFDSSIVGVGLALRC